MASSVAAICNRALTFLGANRISSLDDDTVEARLCKEHYEDTLSDLLRSHPWKFAIARASLGLISTTPTYEWDYQYQLPSDCLRVIGMEGHETDDWTVEGNYLLTNATEAKIKYIKKITTVGLFDPSFTTVLALDIAILISYSITTSQGIRNDLIELRKEKIKEARTYSAQEAVGNRVYADEWLNSRY